MSVFKKLDNSRLLQIKQYSLVRDSGFSAVKVKKVQEQMTQNRGKKDDRNRKKKSKASKKSKVILPVHSLFFFCVVYEK